MLIKKGPFFLVHLCIGFVFWIQTTSEDNTAQGLPTITYIIVTYISKRLNVSQVGILWYIDSLMDFLFFNELHFLFGIFFYFSWQNNKLVYLQRIGKKLNEQVPIWNGQKGIRIFTKKPAFEFVPVTDSCPISANLNKQITLVINNKYCLKIPSPRLMSFTANIYRMVIGNFIGNPLRA